MAGRRKKKERRSDASYKPPLVFTESPVQGRKFYCTPVQAARRPFLAPSVPVDQDSSKWVSPQFENTICSSPYLKPSRRQQKGKQRHRKENEAPASKQVLTRSSLPALAFLNGNQDTNRKEEDKRTAGNHNCDGGGTCTQRRSKRIQEKEKRTHFLFEKIASQTPSKIREMTILADETPEHLMPRSRTGGRGKPGDY